MAEHPFTGRRAASPWARWAGRVPPNGTVAGFPVHVGDPPTIHTHRRETDTATSGSLPPKPRVSRWRAWLAGLLLRLAQRLHPKVLPPAP